MAHPIPLKKRKKYKWRLLARNKRGTVLFNETGTCSDPVLAQISILQLIKLNATHKWDQIDSRTWVMHDPEHEPDHPLNEENMRDR